MTDENHVALAAEPEREGRSSTAAHTPGPWEYIASNEDHGPCVVSRYGGDIAYCYTMSNLSDRAVCNGGTSKPIHFQDQKADANARLIAAAPDMLAALQIIVGILQTGVETHLGKKIAKQIDAALRKATGAA